MSKKIKEVNREKKFANEYGDSIEDYSKVKSPLSNRLIKPYITSETHGENVFDGILELLDILKPQSILDLGCGAGELLYKIKDIKIKVGCTIHIGEAIYAKEVYNIDTIIPLDMREAVNYFMADEFECIIAHCSLQFIVPDERQILIKDAYDILSKGGTFIVVDYKYNKETGIEGLDIGAFTDISNKFNVRTMGKLTVLQK
jgi:SAM-dependent methyltransferase